MHFDLRCFPLGRNPIVSERAPISYKKADSWLLQEWCQVEQANRCETAPCSDTQTFPRVPKPCGWESLGSSRRGAALGSPKQILLVAVGALSLGGGSSVWLHLPS